jgi:short-subunit dehydrogenase
MARRSLAGARVLITGASRGIGLSLARELAAAGSRLLLHARDERLLASAAAELASLHPGREAPLVLAGDITLPATRHALVAAVASHWGGLDVLVNNAGVGARGPFRNASPECLRQVMEVNFFAPVELIRALLPLLVAGRQPLIVNVGSILARRAIPRTSEYCASKFALHGFSEALRAELAPSGVDVLMVHPGTTETGFEQRLIENRGDYRWRKHSGAPPHAVARATVRATAAGGGCCGSIGGRPAFVMQFWPATPEATRRSPLARGSAPSRWG